MGNKICSTCDCNKAEVVTDLDLKATVRGRQQLQFPASDRVLQESNTDRQSTREASMSISAGKKRQQKPKPNYDLSMDQIVHIQSAWRGYQDRKQFVHIKKQSQHNHPYFSPQEIKETLSRYMSPAAAEEKPRKRQYKNGAVYEGQWLGGFRHGQGTMAWPDGARYEGEWQYGKPFGYGVFTHLDGDVFDGDWHMSTSSPSKLSREERVLKVQLRDGYSTDYAVWLVYKQEQFKLSPPKRKPQKEPADARLEEMKTNFETMVATIEGIRNTLDAGMKYSGMAGRSVKRLVLPNNNVYEGEVTGADKRDGMGKNTWHNGDIYEGEWKDDTQNGSGRNVWVDGSVYVGQYVRNKKHGVGDYLWDDKSRYVGEWRDDKMHGIGKYSWPDGKYYFGEWLNGVLHGYGEFRWSDGKRYVGPWAQGKKHGTGTTTFPDGRVSRDHWVNGKVESRH